MVQIKKSYRKLAVRYHPDKTTSDDKLLHMAKLNKAMAVLSDPKVREAYDYYLDYPNDMLALFYGIRAVYPSRTNPFLVIFLVLVFLSLIQYVHSYYNLVYTRNMIQSSESFLRAVKADIEKDYGSKYRKLSNKEQKTIKTETIERLFEECVRVDGSFVHVVYWNELIFFRFFLIPIDFLKYIGWHLNWFWSFTIKRLPYGPEEKNYLTAIRSGNTWTKWNSFTDTQKNDLLAKELWIYEKYQEWLLIKEEEDRISRINSGKYRQQKRMKKKRRFIQL